MFDTDLLSVNARLRQLDRDWAKATMLDLSRVAEVRHTAPAHTIRLLAAAAFAHVAALIGRTGVGRAEALPRSIHLARLP